jgi:hypothetical protein
MAMLIAACARRKTWRNSRAAERPEEGSPSRVSSCPLLPLGSTLGGWIVFRCITSGACTLCMIVLTCCRVVVYVSGRCLSYLSHCKRLAVAPRTKKRHAHRCRTHRRLSSPHRHPRGVRAVRPAGECVRCAPLPRASVHTRFSSHLGCHIGHRTSLVLMPLKIFSRPIAFQPWN